jgi:hypothetical protein
VSATAIVGYLEQIVVYKYDLMLLILKALKTKYLQQQRAIKF